MEKEKIKTSVYKTSSGKEPLSEWLETLEFQTQVTLSTRLTRVRSGNTGSCKPLKGYAGIYEIVIDCGPGYRIYYGQETLSYFILLFGGEKKSQKRDIKKAYHYWIDHKRTKS